MERPAGPIRVGILTVSDACSRGRRQDASGQLLEDWCREKGHRTVFREIVPDRTDAIVSTLLGWADGGAVDVIVTTGGTGFGPRDVTPEATAAVLEREAPGVAEMIRRHGLDQTPFAALSRGLAGSRGSTFIVNLPGSPGGVGDGIHVLDIFLRHLVELLRGLDPPHESVNDA